MVVRRFAYRKVPARRSRKPLVRANYGLKVGKFEMDYDDGEIRVHVAHVLTEGELDDAVIARLFGTGMALLDRYLPAVLSVIYGNELPRDAIRSVEQPDVSEAA